MVCMDERYPPGPPAKHDRDSVSPVGPRGTTAIPTKGGPVSGTKDRAKGTVQETKGKVKEAVGDVTDDERLEREGRADQLKGNGKKAVGHAKDAATKVKEGVEDAIDHD